jgi:hypothetical protein
LAERAEVGDVITDAVGVEVADAEGVAGRIVRSPEFRASGLNRNNY